MKSYRKNISCLSDALKLGCGAYLWSLAAGFLMLPASRLRIGTGRY